MRRVFLVFKEMAIQTNLFIRNNCKDKNLLKLNWIFYQESCATVKRGRALSVR